jgi:hypothetical protein
LSHSFLTLSTCTDEIAAADLVDEADRPPSGAEALRHKQDSAYWNSSTVDDEDDVDSPSIVLAPERPDGADGAD